MRRETIGWSLALLSLASTLHAQPGHGPISGGGGGGGAGVTGLTSCADGTAIADNALLRGDGTTKCQGSAITVADTTGDLQWEGTTADAFEGNFTFADPTADWTWAWGAAGDLVGAGSLSIDNLRLDGNTISSTDTNGNINLDPNGNGAWDAGYVSIGGFNAGISAESSQALYLVSNDEPQLEMYAAKNTMIRSGGQYTFSYANWVSSGYYPDTGIARLSAGVVRGTDGNIDTPTVRWLQGGGAAVASAAALPVPTGRVFHVTGTTNITSITSTNFQSGVCVTLIFDDALTFTDGNNLKLAGNFVTTADDTWSGCFDGTNWHESSRSVN